MKVLLVIIFYGLAYYVFESLFNFITIDLKLPKNKKNWKQKLRLKTIEPCSFWMIPNGSIIGVIFYFMFEISIINMNYLWCAILVCLCGGIVITLVELGSGMLLNVLLKLNLWNYDSKIKLFGKVIPINFKGQIDLWHSLGWCAMTYLFWVINHILK